MNQATESKPGWITISLDAQADLARACIHEWDALTEALVAMGDEYDRIGAQREAVLRMFARRFCAEAEAVGKEHGIDVAIDEIFVTRDVAINDGDPWERIIWQAAHDRISHADIVGMIDLAKKEVK